MARIFPRYLKVYASSEGALLILDKWLFESEEEMEQEEKNCVLSVASVGAAFIHRNGAFGGEGLLRRV